MGVSLGFGYAGGELAQQHGKQTPLFLLSETVEWRSNPRSAGCGSSAVNRGILPWRAQPKVHEQNVLARSEPFVEVRAFASFECPWNSNPGDVVEATAGLGRNDVLTRSDGSPHTQICPEHLQGLFFARGESWECIHRL
jgi:hypothetical protein